MHLSMPGLSALGSLDQVHLSMPGLSAPGSLDQVHLSMPGLSAPGSLDQVHLSMPGLSVPVYAWTKCTWLSLDQSMPGLSAPGSLAQVHLSMPGQRAPDLDHVHLAMDWLSPKELTPFHPLARPRTTPLQPGCKPASARVQPKPAQARVQPSRSSPESLLSSLSLRESGLEAGLEAG
eukprot:gene25538-11182_t